MSDFTTEASKAMTKLGLENQVMDGVSQDDVARLFQLLYNQDGKTLRVPPAAELRSYDPKALRMLMHIEGIYLLPSEELVVWLKEQVGDRKAIEIAAGNGVLGRALGIPMTDNRMQERPEILMQLQAMGGQPPVQYGADVIKRDANPAVRTMKPEVVVASWATHLYKQDDHARGGNMYGIDEMRICELAEYIHIGSRKIHSKKRILDLPHEEHDLPGLIFSRGDPEERVVRIWRKA